MNSSLSSDCPFPTYKQAVPDQRCIYIYSWLDKLKILVITSLRKQKKRNKTFFFSSIWCIYIIMRVYWVFPKPLDIKPSVLDGILGLQFALCGTGNFKQAACTSNIFYWFKFRWLARVALDIFWLRTGYKTYHFSISQLSSELQRCFWSSLKT